jgi:hypothetical protein
MHAAIPTPTILLNKRPKLRRVIVLFSAKGVMDELHIFDASNRIKVIKFVENSPRGEHLMQDDVNTFGFGPDGLEISFALGISMLWSSADPQAPSPRQVFIGAVGADFEIAD